MALFVLVSFFPSPLFAREAVLANIAVAKDEQHLLVGFTVKDCFTEDMEKAIHAGINVTLTFFFEVNEIRKWWWDRGIAYVKKSHHIEYDSLKRDYVVTLTEGSGKPVRLKDFMEAKRLMSRIIDLKVAALHELGDGRHFQVRMMAELDKIKLPFNLHSVLFFLSLWDFETEWYTVDFTY
ncbi:MAG: DUF4390 domain-containing protein [Deltaproteobacteria bacterium]|nr:DUF4390 domain-containing protein [Deltaproteobacteria bacterium]